MSVPIIETRDLRKSFELGDVVVHALNGVSVEVAQGQFVAIVGKSGSGKSTFMNILGCLDRPSSGTYRLDGRDISDRSADERAELRSQQIGFVFQAFNLIPRTSALENVELPLVYGGVTRLEQRRRGIEALERVGLAGRADHHPSQLSGGEQQRVAIARALVNRPRLLLADEPTGNLDSNTSVEIMQIIEDLNREQGITVVLVTHEPEIAAHADRVLTFRDGEIVVDTPRGRVLPDSSAPSVEPGAETTEDRA
ncbi:MAG: ABC transporter ATP-binding protein [Myxococcota bacterium]|nr:ABC transporter ATP-binding protein [Myxococcota bacterium]